MNINHKILSGFNIFLESRVPLICSITFILSSPISLRRCPFFPTPTPCSPVHVPPKAMALFPKPSSTSTFLSGQNNVKKHFGLLLQKPSLRALRPRGIAGSLADARPRPGRPPAGPLGRRGPSGATKGGLAKGGQAYQNNTTNSFSNIS